MSLMNGSMKGSKDAGRFWATGRTEQNRTHILHQPGSDSPFELHV